MGVGNILGIIACLTLIIAIIFGAYKRQKENKKAILIINSRFGKAFVIFIFLICCAFSFVYIKSYFLNIRNIHSGHRWFELLNGVINFLAGVIFLINGPRYLICEDGIKTTKGYIKWKDIKKFDWGFKHNRRKNKKLQEYQDLYIVAQKESFNIEIPVNYIKRINSLLEDNLTN